MSRRESAARKSLRLLDESIGRAWFHIEAENPDISTARLMRRIGDIFLIDDGDVAAAMHRNHDRRKQAERKGATP